MEEEEGDWSSEKGRPHGRSKFGGRPSIIPDWDSLPPELVERIADRVLLTTGGVDSYMDMRAVCQSWHFAIPSWRSAIAKASQQTPLAAVADLRFRPRNWIMVGLKSRNHDNDDTHLFLHTSTGCFRRLRIPVLREHLVLGASDGLILLREKEHPHLARLLNPFTGDMIYFAAPLLENFEREDEAHTAVSGGPHWTLVVWRDLEWRWDTVLYADPTSEEFTEEHIGMPTIHSMVSFRGDIYYAGSDGCVFKFVTPADQCDHELVVIAQMPLHMDIYLERDDNGVSYLVESAGELLLVRYFNQTMKVFRVNVGQKMLEEVKSIGGCRALFLGNERCVSVNSDKLPSVDGDCVYMFNWAEIWGYRGHVMCFYNLRDGTMEIMTDHPRLRANNNHERSFHKDPWNYSYSAKNHHLRPLSLIQVLLDYCNDAEQF